MRRLLLLFALVSAVSRAKSADSAALATNSIPFGEHSLLEAFTPANWTLIHTNPAGLPPSVDLHSPSNTIILRLSIRGDNSVPNSPNPKDADMEKIVSNVVQVQYLPISVETNFVVEKLKGPGVTGFFVRLTDAGWTPMITDEFHNLGTGMFRCENLWGTFDLVTFDKDGPLFTQGLKVMESLHRKP